METPRSLAMDQEALFSLEVVVDKLSIPDVVCRFPAVAFRLLDFPTLVIYHVEPDLAETIKKKVLVDPYYRLPAQLHELKDKTGDFPVKKGKSCLFKVTPQALQSHLHNTPLYVMMLDTYPETPKLIGSCLVPLDVTVDKVFTDICKLGIATPAVHGEKGEYQVYNLMGSPIGELKMGFRLLSLGVGLIQHIPDHAIQRVGRNREEAKIKPEDAADTKVTKATDVVIHDLESADKDIQVVISDPVPQLVHNDTQTDKDVLIASRAHTSKDGIIIKKKSKKGSQKPITEGFSDFFITNTVCPPPLFYNSNAEEPQVSEGLQFYDNPSSAAVPDNKYATGIFEVDEESSSSSEDTIRTEDKFSDSDTETQVDFKAAKILQTQTPIKKIKGQPTLKAGPNLVKPSPVPMNANNFPLLNALMTEILNLKGQTPSDKSHSVPGTPKKESPASHSVPSTPKTKADVAKENREEFLARLATPRGASVQESPGASKRAHQVCGRGDQAVPKNKSWIRSVPTYGVKKTKLAYGMTNTQRLRLAKGNPELLKTLEEAENTRKGLQRITRQESSGKEVLKNKSRNFATPDASKSCQHGQEIPRSPHVQVSALEMTGNSDVRESSELRSRRPVPTPRMSLKGEKEMQVLKESGTILARIRKNQYAEFARSRPQSWRKSVEIDEEQSVQDSEGSKYKKSLEVHIPSASIHGESDALSNATGLDNSDFEDDRLNIKHVKEFGTTKTIYNPGFPAEIPVRDFAHEPNYSDDFELSARPAKSVEDIGLRKIVDHYSDDEDSSEKSGSPSYHSAHSKQSQDKNHDLKLKIPSLPNPTSSNLSPKQPMSKLTLENALATRQPMATSASVEPGMGESVDSSTAYISRSQVFSQSYDTGNSMDSTGEPTRKPKPTPRRQWSIRTESVSSYAPSEGDRMSPIDDASDPESEDYSEEFEDSSMDDPQIVAKDIKDFQLSKVAKLGYTWAPG